MTEDADGNIWAFCSGKSRKLIRIRDFQVREEFPTSQIPLGRIAPDPQGGIWIGPRSGGNLVLFPRWCPEKLRDRLPGQPAHESPSCPGETVPSSLPSMTGSSDFGRVKSSE